MTDNQTDRHWLFALAVPWWIWIWFAMFWVTWVIFLFTVKWGFVAFMIAAALMVWVYFGLFECLLWLISRGQYEMSANARLGRFMESFLGGLAKL